MTTDEYLSKHDRLVVAKDARDCFNLLSDEFDHPSYYYRGVSRAKYRLLSSLDRLVAQARHRIIGGSKFHKGFREQLLIREFKKVARNHLTGNAIPTTQFEWLSLMQHYGVSTRLLDVTRSPFIALYFAVRDWSNADDGAAVWAIAPHKLHEASSHRLSKNEFPYPIREPWVSYSEMPDFAQDHYFSEAFLSGKHKVSMILEPSWSNERLACQQGAFIVSGGESLIEDAILDLICDSSYKDPIEAEMEDKHRIDMSLMKLIIPGKVKKDVFNRLRRMNIYAATLFPGIEGAARGVLEYGTAEEWKTMETEETRNA